MIISSLDLNKSMLTDSLRGFGKPKGKLFIKTIIIYIIEVLLAISAIVLFLFKLYGIGIALVLLLSFIQYFAVKATGIERTNKNRDYARYIEEKLVIKAKELNSLPISVIAPLFIKTVDSSKSLTIYFNDDVILDCNYDDIKGYNIYYNDTYPVKKRLPSTPLKLVKSYLLEINVNDTIFKLKLYNTYSEFLMNDKIDYIELVNTKTINGLAGIIDKITKRRK